MTGTTCSSRPIGPAPCQPPGLDSMQFCTKRLTQLTAAKRQISGRKQFESTELLPMRHTLWLAHWLPFAVNQRSNLDQYFTILGLSEKLTDRRFCPCRCLLSCQKIEGSPNFFFFLSAAYIFWAGAIRSQ